MVMFVKHRTVLIVYRYEALTEILKSSACLIYNGAG